MIFVISMCLGAFVYSAILIILHVYGERADAMQRRLTSVLNSDKKSTAADDELSKPLMERFVKPLIKKQAEFLSRFAPSKSRDNKAKLRREKKLKTMLYKAGLGISVAEFRFVRFMVTAGAMIFCTVIALLSHTQPAYVFLAALFGIYAGFAATRFYLTATITKRKKSMEKQLPDVLDLLSVSVEAGLGFEQAISQIISHFEGPLIDELAVTYREMAMGRTRRDALILLGERCDLEEMKSFVGSLVQASQLGISMKNVLRAQAGAMRQSRRSKVEEKAMKISVKILIPMVVFIFPVIFLVLLGPAVVNIMEVMG